MCVVTLGIEAVRHLPCVGHTVAIIVHFAISQALVVVARVVVGVSVAVGVDGDGIGSRQILVIVVEAVLVGVAILAVGAIGGERVEPVRNLPPVGHAVAVGIDGFKISAFAKAIPQGNVDIRDRVDQRDHVRVERHVLVVVEMGDLTREVLWVFLPVVSHGREVRHPVRVGGIRHKDGIDIEIIRHLYSVVVACGPAVGRRSETQPVLRSPPSVAQEVVVVVVHSDHGLDVNRRIPAQVRGRVFDDRHVKVRLVIDARPETRAIPPAYSRINRSVGPPESRVGETSWDLVRVCAWYERIWVAVCRRHNIWQVVEREVVEDLLREGRLHVGYSEILLLPCEPEVVDRSHIEPVVALAHVLLYLLLSANTIPYADLINPPFEFVEQHRFRGVGGIATHGGERVRVGRADHYGCRVVHVCGASDAGFRVDGARHRKRAGAGLEVALH